METPAAEKPEQYILNGPRSVGANQPFVCAAEVSNRGLESENAAPGRIPGAAFTPPVPVMRTLVLVLLGAIGATACGNGSGLGVSPPPDTVPTDPAAFLDDVQERTFAFFWETTIPANGLTPDRWPDMPFSSIAAVGFALTAYPIGVERGWVSRTAAAERTRTTLQFFRDAPQGPSPTEVTGYRGFFYHFLELGSGMRTGTTELSTIDTALLLGGVLTVREYFDGSDPAETEIRAMADSIYRRVEWDWAVARPPLVALAWSPEDGFSPYDWRGYNEAMLIYILALGSPTHPVDPAAWEEWTRTYTWAAYYGQPHVNFAPLFGHQYTHVWVDFRGIQDAYMRGRGIDYFENSRRAALAQRAYAVDNPGGWAGYGENLWGLTASDGPGDFTFQLGGQQREFRDYWARGASAPEVRDDGTLAPTAAAGSVPFVPDLAIGALWHMVRTYGTHLYGEYGFRDAFNPSLGIGGAPVGDGTVVPGVGWFDEDYLGIDQGPVLAMIENHRSELVWELMRQSPYIVSGLCRAGFTGGWLEGRC